MRAIAAFILHVLSVHYLFALFTVGVPCLILSFLIRKKAFARRFFIQYLLIAVFVVTLIAGYVFPPINFWYLQNYGMKGEGVIVNTFQNAGWFNQSPEIRLVLRIQPDDGDPFYEAVSTVPPLDEVSHLQIGRRINILYAPQYTHDIAIAEW